jgi:glyoxylase-like metal-dependent hydrolase (beta-lactamase superfamily II)
VTESTPPAQPGHLGHHPGAATADPAQTAGATVPGAAGSDRRYGIVTVLFGDENGKYPDGNALVIDGPDRRLLVDPSLTVAARRGVPGGPVDQIVVSHAHEDHVAALHLFPDVPVLVHEADRVGVHEGVDGLLQIYGYMYGMDEAASAAWRDELLERFHVVARPDAATFTDGHVFDLGGGHTATVVHLPGHTLGHCGLLVEPEGFFFVADVDLTGFGPYYGDAWSDLEGFELSLQRCRDIDARWFATFHHKGVIDGREPFLEQLESFGDVIRRREDALLSFLREPRSLDDIVEHRFVYRPTVVSNFVPAVERRSAQLHLARLVPAGLVAEIAPGRYQAVA